MPPQPLTPETLLPSGWSIDPVTGYCIRISDGAQFGHATGQAIAWSTRDIEAQQPDAMGLAVDVARLRNAIGCAINESPLTGDPRRDQRAVDAIHAAGAELAEAGGGEWAWRPEHAVDAKFHQHLGCFLDAVGIERAHLPSAEESGGEAWLLAGCIGSLAVRSELTVRAGAGARVRLLAQACPDVGSAMRRAHAWAIDVARAYLAASAETATAFLHRIPFHAEDAACTRLIHALDRLLADCAPRAADPPPAQRT